MKTYNLVTSLTSWVRGNIVSSPNTVIPSLAKIREHGVSPASIEKCRIGFNLFEEFKRFGWKDLKQELTEGCIKLAQTKLAQPQHYSVFFGVTAYLLRHNLIQSNQINEVAAFQAEQISNKLTPEEVQAESWKKFVSKEY